MIRMRYVRKIIFMILLLAVGISLLCFCDTPEDKVLASIGEISSREFYSCGVFQDFTDYAKYIFVDANIEESPYFSRITDDSAVELNLYIDDFESWVDVIGDDEELVVNYDFDRSIISEGDYVYIEDRYTEESLYSKFDSYNVYFFDAETQVLYYFHNNI